MYYFEVDWKIQCNEKSSLRSLAVFEGYPLEKSGFDKSFA